MTPSDFSADVAVIVGIAAYDSVLGTLQTPVRDATAVSGLLASRFGYQVILQCDGTATLSGLRTLLHEDLPRRVPEGSRLLFYFAGHGVALPNAEIEGPQGYLVPYGATTKPETHLPMNEVHKALMKLPCRHLLVVLDCCFSGAFRWANQRPTMIPEAILYEECYRKWLRYPAHWALASTAHDDYSIDSPDRRRGRKDDLSPFASALRDGLSGEADLGRDGGDGIITLAELNAYLLNRLAPLQTPLMMPLPGQSKGAFVFRDLRRIQPLVSAEQVVVLNEDENPYQGLEPYGAGKAELFFGRTRTVRRLLRHVRRHALTVVTGPSGCGKSSLVQAGLQARLQARRLDRHSRGRGRKSGWVVPPPLRVTADPFTVLAEALAQAGGPQAPSPDVLRSDPEAAQAWSSAWVAAHPWERLLLVVDQAEELITRVPLDASADRGKLPVASAAFLSCLGNLLEAGGGRLRVVVTVRSDYEPDLEPSAKDPLAPLWTAGRFLVPPLSRDELREVIEGPADSKALYFDDPALVDRLIDEVVGMPGGLPLLSYALSRLYLAYLKNRRRDRLLTAEDLASIGSGGTGAPGGIVRILREEADRAEQELPDSSYREVLWNILLRMVNLGGARPTRRQVSLAELDYFRSGENRRRDEVLRRFIEEERLLVSSRDGIEPAHDELLVSWPELKRRIDAARERIPVHRRLTETAAAWDDLPNPPRKGLDLRLLGLVEGTILPVEWLNRAEMSYLTAAREERRGRARLQWRLVAMAFLLTVGAAIFFFAQNQRNIRLRYESTIQSLINQSEADLGAGQTARGLLLAQQAFRFLPRSEGDLEGRVDQLFRRVLDDLPPSRVLLRNASPQTFALHPSGRLLAAGQQDALVLLPLPEQGIDEAGPARRLPGQPAERLERAAFSSDGAWLAAGFDGGSLCLWHVSNLRPAGRATCVRKAQSGTFASLAFFPDRPLLSAVIRRNNLSETSETWKLAGTPASPELRRLPSQALIPAAEDTIQLDSGLSALCRQEPIEFAVIPNGQAVIACDDVLRLWDRRPGPGGWSRGVGRKRRVVPGATLLVARPGHPTQVAIGDQQGNVQILDTEDGRRIDLPRPRTAGLLGLDPGALTHCQGRGVAALAWSADGETLQVLGKDGFWRAGKVGEEPHTSWLGGCVSAASGSADGAWLAVLIEVAPRQTLLELLPTSGSGEPIPIGDGDYKANQGRIGLAFHPSQLKLLVGLGAEAVLWTRSSQGTWSKRSLVETDGPIFAAAWAKEGSGEDVAVLGGRGFDMEGFVEAVDMNGRSRRRWGFARAPVSGLAFDPVERRLAASTTGGGLKLLSLGHSSGVPAILGSINGLPKFPVFPNPTQIAALSGDEVSLWNVGTSGLAGALCGTIASNLFVDDWISYVDPAPDRYEMACPDPEIGPHPSLIAYADSLAWTGNDVMAQRLYKRLNELKAGTIANPARRVQAQRLARGLARFNGTDRELVLAGIRRAEEYKTLRRAEGLPPIPLQPSMRLCRWGVLFGEAARALPFCEQGVKLSSSLPSHEMFLDSRGLARAALGDLQGAREDFLASRDALSEPAWRSKRQAWIDALDARHNPITPGVLEELAREEMGIELPRRKVRLATR